MNKNEKIVFTAARRSGKSLTVKEQVRHKMNKLEIRAYVYDWIEEHYAEEIKHAEHTDSLIELIQHVLTAVNETETKEE